MKVKDLNNESREYAKIQGYSDDDIIEYLEIIYPKALTTCIQGVCNDKSGCGLATKFENEDCGCKGNCDIPKTDNVVIGDDEKTKVYRESLAKKILQIKIQKAKDKQNEKGEK
jgi:hypothetical protein